MSIVWMGGVRRLCEHATKGVFRRTTQKSSGLIALEDAASAALSHSRNQFFRPDRPIRIVFVFEVHVSIAPAVEQALHTLRDLSPCLRTVVALA